MKRVLLTAASALILALSLVVIVASAKIAFNSPKIAFEKRSESAKSAAEIYEKSCASCHGKDGQAKTVKAKFNHARNLTDSEWQGKATDERLFNSISNGKGKMPAFGKKLSDDEINSLVPYVRGLKK
jgi:cytochrome c6